jgi:hypothetical protein
MWNGGRCSPSGATPAKLAHQKFGVRLRIGGNLILRQAYALLAEIRKKLRSAVRTVEGLLAQTAGATLNAGNVTVVNQHRKLRHAYDYFRARATNPDEVEDVHESGTFHGGRSWSTFLSGKQVMAMHAFHDLVAAISAFLSRLEHRQSLGDATAPKSAVTDKHARISKGGRPFADPVPGVVVDRLGNPLMCAGEVPGAARHVSLT